MSIGKGQFQIGSGRVFSAKSIKITYDSLASEDSGRTLDGVMHITWIKPKLRKWEILMPPCSDEDMQDIIAAVQGKEYDISVYDPGSKSWGPFHVYTSSATSDCYSGVLGYNGLWQGFTFSAIEMGV